MKNNRKQARSPNNIKGLKNDRNSKSGRNSKNDKSSNKSNNLKTIKSLKAKTTKNAKSNTKNEKLLEGTILGTKQSYVFCAVEGMNDFFVPATKTKGALHGDKVLIKPLSMTEQSQEAQVVRVLSRANTILVGEVIKHQGELFFKADNPKISKYILLENTKENQKLLAQKVVCKLTYQPQSSRERFKGEIIEVLGDKEDTAVLEKALLREYNIYETFPEEVLAKAKELSQKGVTENDKKNRLDLTKEEIFTIDGEDARDFDDAISLEILPNGNFYLGVHIADVGYYVPKDGVIDKEAFLRGTSVYFPTMVFPMLPEELSNDICSLKENVDRLTMSVFMEVDKNGEVKKYKIAESVIKSKGRLTYNQVHAVLIGADNKNKAFKFVKTLKKMQELSIILKNRLKRNGELDFDLKEPYFIIDDNNKIVAIEERERNEAHTLIESFMILTNEVIAKHHFNLNLPFLYRVHEAPTKEKVDTLLDFLKNFEITIKKAPEVITSAYMKEILKAIEHLPIKETLNKVVLRSLKKAVYKPEKIGHFGLALADYSHFTSPIRRYPDLVIHRIVKDTLHNKKQNSKMKNFVFEAGEQSSNKERNADEAERAMDDLKKAEYMQSYLGKEFEGIITSVTNFGFFVELDNTVEGLVRLETLPKDGYLFFEKSLMLKGLKHTYSVGDKVKVILANVSLQERKIDFVLV